jgi:hypothetical protein
MAKENSGLIPVQYGDRTVLIPLDEYLNMDFNDLTRNIDSYTEYHGNENTLPEAPKEIQDELDKEFE